MILGQLGKVHGIKGWIKLHSYTDPPDNILEYRTVLLVDPERLLELDRGRWQGKDLLVHFKGIDDPESARRLTGREVAVDSSELPSLEGGEHYWHELLNMQVCNRAGQNLGRVSRLLETGANDVLVVAATASSIDARERLIPYLTGTVIERIDKGSGVILVDWPADYLD